MKKYVRASDDNNSPSSEIYGLWLRFQNILAELEEQGFEEVMNQLNEENFDDDKCWEQIAKVIRVLKRNGL